jgi:NADH:ubiquinone oxidoreductase subunit E
MMSATAEGGGTGAVNSSEVTGRPAQALPTFLQDVDRAQTDEMIRLLAQATAHYGGATAEAIDDVASKFNITTEQVDEVIRWIETAEPESELLPPEPEPEPEPESELRLAA